MSGKGIACPWVERTKRSEREEEGGENNPEKGVRTHRLHTTAIAITYRRGLQIKVRAGINSHDDANV